MNLVKLSESGKVNAMSPLNQADFLTNWIHPQANETVNNVLSEKYYKVGQPS